MRWLTRRRSTKFPNLPFGLRCMKRGDKYLLKGKVVIIPYTCWGTTWTNISSFRFVGGGRLSAETGSSCLVTLIPNSFLNPMSSHWASKNGVILTSNRSTIASSSGVN